MSAFFKTLEKLSKKIITENEINAIKRNLNYCSFCNKNEREKLRELLDYFNNPIHYSITRNQTIKGINYLKSKIFRKNGELRKINQTTLLNDLNESDLNIIRNFKKFLLIGFYDYSQLSNNYGGYLGEPNYFPVYRVIAKNGNYFDYLGMQFEHSEVINRGEL